MILSYSASFRLDQTLRNLLWLALWLLPATLVYAQPHKAQELVLVTGQVLDGETGLPLALANVIGNGGEKATLTDMNGQFSLMLSRSDTMTLRIRYTGYTNYLVKLPSTNEAKIIHNVTLNPESSLRDEVIISAAKFQQKAEDLPVTVETLKPAAVDRQASSQILKALEQTPGVTINQGQINIRGSSGFANGTGSRVFLMLDGMPLLSAEAGDARFDMFPVDNIKSIEIVKGASSVLYGTGALGGVVSVMTNDPSTTPFTSLRIRTQLYDRPANPENHWDNRPLLQRLTQSIHAVHARRIGQLDVTAQVDGTNYNSYRELEDAQQYRGYLKLRYHFKRKPGLSIGLNALASQDNSAFWLTWQGYPGGALQPAVDRARTRPGDTVMDVIMRRNLHTALDPHLTLVTNRGNVHTYRGRIFTTRNRGPNRWQNATGTQYFNEYQYIHHFADYMSLVSGINYTYADISSDSIYGDHYSTSLAAFTQAEITAGRLKVSAGARYQQDNINGGRVIDRPIFRAGLNFRLTEGTFLRGSFGQGFRNPSIRERFIQTSQGAFNVVPNPAIEIEEGYNIELGARQYWKIGEWKGMLDVAGFQMNFTNMVELMPYAEPGSTSLPVIKAQNIGQAQITGYEVSVGAEGNVGPLKMQFNGGYTYINPIDPNGDKSMDGNDDPRQLIPSGSFFPTLPDRPYTLKYRSKHLVRGSYTVEYRKVSMTVNGRFNSKIINVDKLLLIVNPGAQAFRETNNHGFTVLDMMVGYEFGKNGRSYISAHVFNLTNEEYMTVPGLLGEQRSFAMQYKLTF